MEIYRAGMSCCVCGERITIMQPRYTEDGLTAHRACAEHVTRAAMSDAYGALSVLAFRETMRAETREIEKED